MSAAEICFWFLINCYSGSSSGNDTENESKDTGLNRNQNSNGRLTCAPKAHWSERKSRRGQPKSMDTSGHACINLKCDYFAIADPEIHALVSNRYRGKQRVCYFKCQGCEWGAVPAVMVPLSII